MRRLKLLQSQLAGVSEHLDITFSDEVRDQLSKPHGARRIVARDGKGHRKNTAYKQAFEAKV